MKKHSTAVHCIVNISPVLLLVFLLCFIFFSLSIKLLLLDVVPLTDHLLDSLLCHVTPMSCDSYVLPGKPFPTSHTRYSLCCLCCFLFNVDFDIIKKIQPWPVWLSWSEDHPVEQNVMGLMTGQGTSLGCGFNPWHRAYEKTANPCFSLLH